MPGCNLSATGINFDVDAFLKTSPWTKVASVFRRGQATGLKLRPAAKHSGLGIEISDPEEDRLEPQIKSATNFIKKNSSELARLTGFPGVDEVELGIGLSWFEDTAAYPLSLPPAFLFLTGKLGIAVTLYICATTRAES